MNKLISTNKYLLLFGIPFSIFAGLILLIKSPLFQTNTNWLSIGITFDLLLTIPIVYFLLIRKTKIPKTTVVPIMVIGLVIGTYFLPKGEQLYLELFKTWILPLIEITIFTFLIIKVRAVIKRYKVLKGTSSDFYSIIKIAFSEILPKKLVTPLATEIAVMYYGFINWKPIQLRSNDFFYHKRSGTPMVLGVFIFMIGVETVAMHLLLARWNETFAWILSGLSIYTAIQLLGFAKSLSQRPISIQEDSVTLRYGILSETTIPLTAIERVELSRKSIKKEANTIKLSPIGEFESHNVVIYLNKTCTLTGLYGIEKPFLTLALHVDEVSEFKVRLDGEVQHFQAEI